MWFHLPSSWWPPSSPLICLLALHCLMLRCLRWLRCLMLRCVCWIFTPLDREISTQHNGGLRTQLLHTLWEKALQTYNCTTQTVNLKACLYAITIGKMQLRQLFGWFITLLNRGIHAQHDSGLRTLIRYTHWGKKKALQAYNSTTKTINLGACISAIVIGKM